MSSVYTKKLMKSEPIVSIFSAKHKFLDYSCGKKLKCSHYRELIGAISCFQSIGRLTVVIEGLSQATEAIEV